MAQQGGGDGKGQSDFAGIRIIYGSQDVFNSSFTRLQILGIFQADQEGGYTRTSHDFIGYIS